MNESELKSTALALVAPRKGLLAADESFPTIKRRFESIGIESTEENRRAYRELLFTTPGIEEFVSGVIMFDETIRQTTSDGVLFPRLLADKAMIPGIKVDEGKVGLPGKPGEFITKGLDGLGKRLQEYKSLGARFTKWRAVIVIGEGFPSKEAINKNARLLAEYASVSQKEGFVPIVEPEVLKEGDHDISRCEEVTRATLTSVFYELKKENIFLEGMLLKPNMVVPGSDSPKKATPVDVAGATLRVFTETVPGKVAGIVFLSGGQTPEEATANLNAINSQGDYPWELGFSFARALQNPVLAAWKGRSENVTMAKGAFYKRARLNSLAREGRHKPEMEKE